MTFIGAVQWDLLAGSAAICVHQKLSIELASQMAEDMFDFQECKVHSFIVLCDISQHIHGTLSTHTWETILFRHSDQLFNSAILY